MLTKIRSVLNYKLTIAELIGINLLIGIPYLAVGLVWSSTHTDHLHAAGAPTWWCRSWGPSCRGRCCCSPMSA